MNHSGRSPMLGDSPLLRQPDGREDAASFVLPELHGSNDSLIDTNFTLYGDITVNRDVNVLAGIVSLHADGNNVYKPVQVFPPVESISHPGRMRSSSSIDDVAKLIEEEMNRDITSYEFRVMENGKSRCTKHTMVKGVLYCMPDKDIPIEVTGAQAGQVVKLGLRYTTGVHHNTPVQACKLHSNSSDPFYSFSIPKCNVIKYEDENHHLMVKIPVTDNIPSEGNFSFSLVFRCSNFCHRDKGRNQEIILKLCDVNDEVLKETSINVRVCKNVNRDAKQEGQVPKQRKRNSNGKMKELPLKKVKTEVEVHGGTGAAATPTPFSYLPPSEIECIRVQVELHPSGLPTLREFLKLLRGRVLSKQGEEEVDSPPIDPLFCPY